MSVVATNQGAILAVQDGARTLAATSEYAPGTPMIRDTAALAPDVQPLLGFTAAGLCSYKPV